MILPEEIFKKDIENMTDEELGKITRKCLGDARIGRAIVIPAQVVEKIQAALRYKYSQLVTNNNIREENSNKNSLLLLLSLYLDEYTTSILPGPGDKPTNSTTSKKVSRAGIYHQDQLQRSNNTLTKPSFSDGDAEPPEIVALHEFFVQSTGLFPDRYQYEDRWLPVYKMWIQLEDGDLQCVKENLSNAIDFARGNNEKKRRYPISSPESLKVIYANIRENHRPPVRNHKFGIK